MYDIVVIGGGVIGGSILRELTKYNLKVCLLEKESDVSMGQSRANSGIVHAGYDAKEGTNKAKFNVLGNQMMEEVCAELGVKFRRNGSLVVAFSDEELQTLKELYNRGIANGVKELYLIDKEELFALEKNISKNAVGALYAKTGGIVCPYELTISAIGNAMDNGADLKLEFEVTNIEKKDGYFIITSGKGEQVESKIVINAAGINSGKMSALAGDNSFQVKGRKGEYILLDRESGDFVSHTLFFTPTQKGKGILVTQTVDNNILLGPTAELVDFNDTSTTEKGLEFIKSKASEMATNIPFYNTITSFTGVRAYSTTNDFVIEESAVKGFINVAGIESPGLTSAPAIAKYVVEEIVAKITKIEENKNFNKYRKPDYFFNRLSNEEKNKIIKEDSTYGNIVCRCEKITEGEIIRAVTENPKATTIDGVKRRTRAGMGRCQGGFCQPRVAEIIARELGIDIVDVTKSGGNSNILIGRTK